MEPEQLQLFNMSFYGITDTGICLVAQFTECLCCHWKDSYMLNMALVKDDYTQSYRCVRCHAQSMHILTFDEPSLPDDQGTLGWGA